MNLLHLKLFISFYTQIIIEAIYAIKCKIEIKLIETIKALERLNFEHNYLNINYYLTLNIFKFMYAIRKLCNACFYL